MSNYDYNVGYLPPPSSFFGRLMRFKGLIISAFVVSLIAYFWFQEEKSPSMASIITADVKASQLEKNEILAQVETVTESKDVISENIQINTPPKVSLITVSNNQKSVALDKLPQVSQEVSPEAIEAQYNAELDALLGSDLIDSLKDSVN